MRRWKQGLASILAVLMLVSALPATALAAEEGQEDPVLTQETEAPAEEVSGEETPAEEVVYNLLDCPVTVGSDEARVGEYAYALFDEQGNYTIALEDNAFFPYEVQFTYGGETWTEWFMDPADTVDVGGHVFSVVSEQTDPSVLTQIGVTVGGEYIPAYPEEKTFSDMPSISTMSLLPLKEKWFTVDMKGLFAEELKEVAVTTVLAGGNVTPAENALVVWAKGYDSDDYAIMDRTGTLDLSPAGSYDSSVYFDLIVGNADQLSMDNTLYNVTVEVSSESNLLTGSAYTADGQAIPLRYSASYSSQWMTYSDGRKVSRLGMRADADSVWDGQSEAKVKLAKGTSDFSNLTMEVYTGLYHTLETLDAAIAAGTTQNVTDAMVDGTGYLADYTSNDGCELTTRWLRNGTAVAVRPMFVELDTVGDSWSYGGLKNAEGMTVSTWSDSYYDDAQRVFVQEYKVSDETYAVDGIYYFTMTYSHNGAQVSDAATYVSAYVGNYRTLEEAAGQTDIAAQLFGTGYPAKYSGDGVTFSVFMKDGTVLARMKVVLLPYEPEVAEEPVPDQEDTYFRVTGANKDTSGTQYYATPMDYDVDGYYYGYPDGDLNFGCQTVFVMDGSSVAIGGKPVADGTEIYPVFELGPGVKAYAGHDGTSGTEQVSGETSVEFTSGKAVQYSATSGSKTLKNYWVTFVTPQTGGAKLYVNAANVEATWDEETGLPTREVYLDSFHDYHHDVFFANIGDAELKGLSVTLEDAQNVQLDEYWTIRENSVAKLAAFDSTNPYDMDNFAKIRLEPIRDENGEIQAGEVSGTLVIKADMGTPDDSDDQVIRIKLTGTAGSEEITTKSIDDGVKYVPYASVIQTNVMGASDAVHFRIVSGSLPQDVTLDENGKLYGVPMVSGSFTFTVEAEFTRSGRTQTKQFTLTVLENTDANVEGSTDTGYELLDRVPAELTAYEDQVFRSQGTYGEFYKFYLDGNELVENQDYKSEEGSTKITIYAQTFRDAGSGTHTIAAEFRTDKSDTNTVKKAAQNYTVPGGSSGSTGTSKPAVNPNANKPSQDAQTTADIFWDISSDDWFYPDVDWAYQQKLMIGVTEQTYAPYGPISSATVVTVLARMDKVDLDDYAAVSYPQIDAGQWYTNAANWAMESGLLPDEHFTGQPPIARAKFAVMLVKYLQHSGIDCTLPEEPVAFADASLMTQEENDAFQVLYQFGIFKGVGNYYMDPQGSTTRAQLAVLLHRLSVFVENQTV